ncbi:hypothetical protein TRFO_11953 [Tritrichomonas foetus]|uniref:Kinetochore protein SPC25 n=1 Tax=Tritrichomonas foetus TaxID=1144522 RepID=A0A1J4J595_9EUKA|nr:hypothetical protein TRFO_11953 [Tritrichomonas foetus]|eukprot:OHS93319.1 hypothetical protein TRFO_11953 [Tritrichomonas foetus]
MSVYYLSKMDGEPDWRQKYKNVKERYNRLCKLRYKSVQEDIKDLQNRIKDHQRMHEETVSEINVENNRLIKQKDRIAEIQRRIRSQRHENERMKSDLMSIDSILNRVLKYPFVKVRCFSPGVYKILINDEMEFQLSKNKSGYLYEPIKIPKIVNLKSFQSEKAFNDANFIDHLLQLVQSTLENQ